MNDDVIQGRDVKPEFSCQPGKMRGGNVGLSHLPKPRASSSEIPGHRYFLSKWKISLPKETLAWQSCGAAGISHKLTAKLGSGLNFHVSEKKKKNH